MQTEKRRCTDCYRTCRQEGLCRGFAIKGGGELRDPEKIVQALVQYWGTIMADPHRSVSDCTRYIESLGLCPRVRQAFPLLVKEFSPKIVEQALEQLPTGALPGLDGVPAGVY